MTGNLFLNDELTAETLSYSAESFKRGWGGCLHKRYGALIMVDDAHARLQSISF
ncbi:hypothetical protein [Peribacillus sp. NPDC060253]|uniref:hypothetical protein n=1 Tax=Peribacillus sp. NPDC060253 TaxID=3347084 RepID=UPI003667D657